MSQAAKTEQPKSTKKPRHSSASRRKSKTSRNPKVKVGCLFSAMGGFAAAFEQAGAKVVWANEKDKNAVQTFRHNFPKVNCIDKPIEELSVKNDRLESIDVLTGGFPCQPFSVAGLKQGFDDKRGMLFLHIIRLLREMGSNKPKILLLENVGNFRAHDHGRTFRRVQREIQKAGYWFTSANAEILNTATHTKVPQNRSRVFMVAMSCDHYNRNEFSFPVAKKSVKLDSVWDYIQSNRKPDQWYYFSEDSQYHKPFVDAIAKFGKKSIYQLRRNYVRENKSGICFTLMANMGEGGHNQPVIKDRWGIRKLTELECAELQGFDSSWFSFPDEVARTQRYKQVGNSVTVPLVKELAIQCIQLCTKKTRKP